MSELIENEAGAAPVLLPYAMVEAGRVARLVLIREGDSDTISLFTGSMGAVLADEGVAVGDLWDGQAFTKPASAFDRAAAARQVDDDVAGIYQRFTRFSIEYEQREAQAQDFKSAGYIGAVPARVAEFATPAGMPAAAAADLILAQAAQLRAAQAQLGTLRMRKYEILRAANDGVAMDLFSEIRAAIAAIGAALS